MKQVVQAVKGTRDFYPEAMAFRQWLYSKIQTVSERFGYQEFDGPEIEYLDLYADKTSEEILKEQAFSLKDRDNRDILLRPEITPTFARMVAQKAQELPKPIRWYSFGRCWRYEQPQKGRAREFFQWEVNILGPESPEADAEILAIATDFFQILGLTPDEVMIRVSDRQWLQSELAKLQINPEKASSTLRIMDRLDKMSGEDWEKSLFEIGINADQITGIKNILSETDYRKSPWLTQVFESLKNYSSLVNPLDYIVFDPKIIRGFDYYTKTVFEAWDKTGGLKRALFGGGRFDNLTSTLGGERVPGVGMAPGDMPIEEVLKQFNKIPPLKPQTAQVLVTVFSADLINQSLKIGDLLRGKGIYTEIWLDKDSKLDKQLKYADQKGIPYAVIIGPEEAAQNKVTLKNLKNKSQALVSIEEAVEKILKND